MKNISESNSYHKPPQEQAAVPSSSAVSAIGRRRKCAMGANVSDGKGDACAQARRTERKGPGLILSANVDEEAISEPCNQCVSIRCMSSAALGSAAICGVEYGGVYLDYTWPLNYFEQQHCLLSQEACTLATTPKKVVSKELDNCWGCGPPSTFLCGSLAVNSSGSGPRKKQLEERRPG